VKRPSARAGRPRIQTPEEKTELAKLDGRLAAIVESTKNLPADPPRARTLEEEIDALPTSDLLHVLATLDARERTDVRDADEIERLRVVRAEIDRRIPRRRA